MGSPLIFVFLLYSLSSITGLVMMFRWRKSGSGIFGTAMLAALGVGLAMDNSRQFIGVMPKLFQAGLQECAGNATCANNLPQKDRPVVFTTVAWACYMNHEILGAYFALPLLQVLDQSRASDWLKRTTRVVITIGATLVASMCAFFFFKKEASTELEYRYNTFLGQWTFGFTGHSPVGLAGVFYFSIFAIILGISLVRTDKIKWFLILQVAAFLAQGASAGLGEAMGVLSNLFEQVSLWSIILALRFVRNEEFGDGEALLLV